MYKKAVLKLILLSSVFCFTNPVFAQDNKQEISVKYQVNKTHCLYNFVSALAGLDFSSSKTLREIFEKSKFNTKKYNDLVTEFQDLRIQEHYYKYSGYPASRDMYKVVSNIFVTISASSTDIDDFSQRTSGLLTLTDHKKLFNIIREFAPVYDDLIWQKSEKDIYSYKEQMNNLSKKSNIGYLFKKAATFYNSQWVDDIPFIVSFYPIPSKNGHSTATPMGNVETVGVLTGQKDLEGSFSIMFHEMCHSLYEAEAPEVQQNIENYFSASKSGYAGYAYSYLNEVLATTIGNGWSYKNVKGELDNTQWYNNKYIENMAKAIYPTVENYLKNTKTIDQEFVNTYIAKFAETFPDALYDYDNLLFNLYVYTDGSIADAKNIKSSLRKNFRVVGLNLYSQIKEPNDLIEGFKADKTVKMFVVSDKKLLHNLFENVDFLKKYKNNPDINNDFLLSIVDKETTYIIISITNNNDFSKVVNLISKDHYINKSFQIKLIDN